MALLEQISSRAWWHTVWSEKRAVDLAETEIDGEVHNACTFILESCETNNSVFDSHFIRLVLFYLGERRGCPIGIFAGQA